MDPELQGYGPGEGSPEDALALGLADTGADDNAASAPVPAAVPEKFRADPISGRDGQGVTVTSAAPMTRSHDRVLQALRVAESHGGGTSVKARMVQLAALGHSTRRIAAILAQQGHQVSHMTVARTLKRSRGSAQLQLILEQDSDGAGSAAAE